MHRADNSSFLLYIEPKIEDKSETPVFDEYDRVLRLAMQDAIPGCANYSDEGDEVEVRFAKECSYRGVHTNCDGTTSSSQDYLLPNGMVTNSLCIYYLNWFRKAIPATEMAKLDELMRFYGKVDVPAIEKKWF